MAHAAAGIREPTESRSRDSKPPSIVGWHGIYLEVPENWELASVAGDMTQGHLRVDGPSDVHARVKWQRIKGKPDVAKILARYLKQVERQGRKAPEGFRSSTDVRLPLHQEQAGRKPTFFSWRTEVQALGLIWHCPACGRVTIAQIDGPAKRNLTLLATQVLGSLDDHAAGGCHTWAVYGLAAEVPADFDLVKNRLLSGYIQLQLARGKTTVILERWGLAEVALKKVSLEEWIRSRCHPTLKSYDYSVDFAEVRGHDGIVLTGKLCSLRDRAAALARTAIRMDPIDRLTQYAWHCEQTNRICSVQVQHSKRDDDLSADISASFVCHT